MTRRLPLLLAVLLALLAARIAWPPSSPAASELVEAVVRAPLSSAAPASVKEVAWTSLLPEANDLAGDAFGVRPPPLPVAPPTPLPPVAMAKVLPAPVQPLAVPPTVAPVVPFQVLGTWDDGKAPGVFLTGPSGVEIARKGMMLEGQYQVVSVSPTQVELLEVTTRRAVQLAVPVIAGRP